MTGETDAGDTDTGEAETGHLETLRATLADTHGLDSWVGPGSIPVLWVDVPQTLTAREMVHVGGRSFVWDGDRWPVADPGRLAARLAAYVKRYPPTNPTEGHWGQGDLLGRHDDR